VIFFIFPIFMADQQSKVSGPQSDLPSKNHLAYGDEAMAKD